MNHCGKKLKWKFSRTWVFSLPEDEDADNGVTAARAAKMKYIAVPERALGDDKRFGIAYIVIHSLRDLTLEMLEN